MTRRFGGLVALDGIDLDVPSGIVQAIIGPNGSGKTTLLNALSGASHADSGSIRIGGNEIFRLKPHRIARLGLSRTFQNIRIFENLSVIENVKVAAACHTPTSLFNIVTSNARQRQSEAEIDRASRDALEIVGLARPSRRSRHAIALRAAAPAGDRPRAGVEAERPAARRTGRRHEHDREHVVARAPSPGSSGAASRFCWSSIMSGW